jgi:serine/threonine protein kinase
MSSDRKRFGHSHTKPALPGLHDSSIPDPSETAQHLTRQETSGQSVRPQHPEFASFFSDSHSNQTRSSNQGAAEALPEHLILGRYRARKWLGEGGFGRVYLAEDTRLNREVAVKVVPVRATETGSSSPSRRRGDSEAKILAKLDHPRIIPVYDVGLDETLGYCTVAKYVRGVTLAARKQQIQFSAREAAALVIEICDGLQHAHQMRVFHRDLKPSNILLDEFGWPHIADFGLAIHEQDQAEHRGEVSGSPSYMAPEQFLGNAHLMDGRADIWSVGVILYELLSGQKPFVGETQDELIEAVLHKDPKPLRLINPEIDATLEQITLRCLRKESADRYPLARDLADALRSWQETVHSPSGTSNPSSVASAEVTSPPHRRHLLLASPILIGVCLLGILGLGQFVSPRGGALQDSPSLPASRIDGHLQVHLWPSDQATDRDVPVSLVDYLPIPAESEVRMEAQLTNEAYAYIFWLDGDGEVFPLYPWREGRWETRPDSESPVTKIELPSPSAEHASGKSTRTSWKVVPTLAMETILLLISPEPLLETFDFEEELSRFRPPQPKRRNTWIEIHEDQLRVHESRERGPVLAPSDSLESAHVRLVQRLKATIPVIRGIAFSTERPRDAPVDDVGDGPPSH